MKISVLESAGWSFYYVVLTSQCAKDVAIVPTRNPRSTRSLALHHEELSGSLDVNKDH